MSRESALEFKVGFFVLAALFVLFFFIVSISDFSFMDKSKKVVVVFNFANGLRDAAPVRLAGVEAGIVKGMDIFNDDADGGKTKVRITLMLKQNIGIPKDSTVTINQLGLIGEKYVEIIPGYSKENYPDNSVIVGHDPMPIERITEQVSMLTTKLNTTVDGVNDILSEKNKQALADTLDGFSAVAKDLKEGRGTIGKLLTDESIYTNLEELTADLKTSPWKLLYRPKISGK